MTQTNLALVASLALTLALARISPSLAQVEPLKGVEREWNAGEALSNEDFLYGAFEARMMASPGPGAITGFVLLTKGAGFDVPWQELAVRSVALARHVAFMHAINPMPLHGASKLDPSTTSMTHP